MKYTPLLIILLLIQQFSTNAKQLTDAQLTQGQIKTLVALTINNPEINYHKKGVKGFYQYYSHKKKVQISGIRPQKVTIEDISIFATLPNMEYFGLFNTNVTDFFSLKKAKKLKRLNIEKHQVPLDLKSVFQIKNLIILTIIECKKISDTQLEGIEALNNLEYLSISNSSIQDISSIAKMRNIKDINILGHPVKNTGNWTNLDSLKYLTIAYCNLSSTSFIKNCKNIKHLNFSGNTITHLDIPRTSVQYIKVDGNNLASLEGIQENEALLSFSASQNMITDITPLTRLKTLKNLDLHKNQISDICPLASLKSLTELNISSNPFTDASCFCGLPNLKKFKASSRSAYPCSPKNIDEIKSKCQCNIVEIKLYAILKRPMYLIAAIFATIFFIKWRKKRKHISTKTND